MSIAQVAPLYESVPPKLYGGTERVVSFLTEELVKQGHEVTLFASADSVTKARLIGNVEEALRLNSRCVDHLTYHIVQLQEVADRAKEFDIIHFHTDYLHFPVSINFEVPHVTTLHGRLNLPELQFLYNKFCRQPVISISDNQRSPLPQANWVATIHHGLPLNLLGPIDEEENYFAFLGRISPEKRVDRAIEIAKAVGIKIKIAAKIDKADQEYFDQEIRALFDHPLVEFIGEINDNQKQQFLGKAAALLFPIDWPEPFGLVMLEAMACGTPVIAFNSGSVPEIIEDGKSGFIVNSVDEAINAVKKLHLLNKPEVRNCFEKRFTAGRMANDYVNVYQKLAGEKRSAQLKYLDIGYLSKNKKTSRQKPGNAHGLDDIKPYKYASE
jgi:glycosyltransferase involved in cell wall biosynthesis